MAQKIVKGYPPNYAFIAQFLRPDADSIYSYGETIFVPSGRQVPEDIMVHEAVHGNRQTDPDEWWQKFCLDPKFRLEEEVLAYAIQYKFCKTVYPAKGYKEALDEFSGNLSSELYGLNLTKSQAETLIRHRANNKTKESS